MRYQFQNAFTHIRQKSTINLFCIITLCFLTLLLSTFLFNHSSIYNELLHRKTTAPIIAFANDIVIEEDARLFANQIRKTKQILHIEYVSKEEHYNRAEQQFGHLGTIIKNAMSGSNPFPALLEIYVDPTKTSRKSLEKIAFELEAYDKIDDVVLTGHGVLTDIFRQTNRMTVASIAITILLSLLFIYTAVLKTGKNRHQEIQLLNLIGATRGYIRIPFVLHGMFIGLIGATLGLACFYFLYSVFTFQLGVLEFLPYYQLIAVVTSSTIIGMFAGILAYRNYVVSCSRNKVIY